MATSIEWTGRTVNFFLMESPNYFPTGEDPAKLGWFCVKKSPGCAHCYAERINLDPRARGTKRRGLGLPFTFRTARAAGWPYYDSQALAKLLRVRKPGKLFPNDMTDTFLSVVSCRKCGETWEDETQTPVQCRKCQGADLKIFWPSSWIQDALDLYDQLAEKGWIIQSLTKRVVRMAREVRDFQQRTGRKLHKGVWLGFSAENQETYDERIGHVLKAGRRADGVLWVSYEPALGPVDFAAGLVTKGSRPALQWGVVGGESGAKARKFQVQWAETMVEQFRAAGAAPFVKQLGRNAWRVSYGGLLMPVRELTPMKLKHAKGGDMEEWPEHLRVREWPEQEDE